MKTYKGFNKDMTCRGFQYEEGKSYEEKETIICETGFHAYEYPLDCFKYYRPSGSIFHVVEQDGKISKHNDDSKVVSTKIKIGTEISIAGLVKAAIEYTKERTKTENDSDSYCGTSSATGDYGTSSATGDYGTSSATGNYGVSSATGYCGASSATGDYGASNATGDYGASSATGNYGASSATGDYGVSNVAGDCGASSATGYCGASSATGYKGASSVTGDYGASSATGNCGVSSATGDYGASSATGNYGASSATGNYGTSSVTGNCGVSSATGYKGSSKVDNSGSIAVAWGYHSKAKGVIGSYLVFADWKGNEKKYWIQDEWHLQGAKMVRVDGINVKENVWYTLKDGELIEA